VINRNRPFVTRTALSSRGDMSTLTQ
jgi:hypothetical protein